MTERQGHLMRHRAFCGHWLVCYSLEPTPTECPDCADAGRKVLKDILYDMDFSSLDILPGDDHELDRWLDESGVGEEVMRNDIRVLARLIDDIRESADHAEVEGRRILARYPAAERLRMPESPT